MAYPHNYGSTVWIFLKYCTIDESNNDGLYQKNFEIGHFWLKNGTSL